MVELLDSGAMRHIEGSMNEPLGETCSAIPMPAHRAFAAPPSPRQRPSDHVSIDAGRSNLTPYWYVPSTLAT
jgi:hypothetical protein